MQIEETFKGGGGGVGGLPLKGRKMILIRLSVTGFRCTDFFSEKIIVGPWEVPHPPFLEEIIVTH